MSTAAQSAPARLPAAPAPGHDSPRAAVAGFLHGLVSGDPMQACDYVDPDQQGNCLTGFGEAPPTSGQWSVGAQLVRHHSALVVGLFEHFCIGSQCQTNTDPNAGLAAATNDFDAAYEQAQQPGKTADVAVVWTQGKWYIEGGVGLSPIPPS